MLNICRKKSQTLIEIVFSVALAAMVISALLVLGAASAKTVSSSLAKSQATKLAVAGLEAVRFTRDTQGFVELKDGTYYIDIASLTPTPPAICPDGFCRLTMNENNASGTSTSTQLFERKIQISSGEYSDYLKRVDVTIRWKAGGKNDGVTNYQEVNVSTILSNWNK